MKDLLQEELTGAEITVTIVGEEYPIAYNMAAAIAYKKATGKSLFDVEESKHLSLVEDPERWLALLWAGLHQEDAEGNWAAPLTLRQLKRLRIADAQLAVLDAKIWSAFRANMPKAKEDPDPNALAPAASVAPAQNESESTSPISTGSGPALVAVSDSPVASS